MIWVLLDLALGLAVLAALAVVLLRLWRTVKALGSQVAIAGDRVAAATEGLDDAQKTRPEPGDGVTSTRRPGTS